MQTIVIVLDSRKMKNPDLDIRYILPDRIEEYTNGNIKDNGYDYISDYELGVWLDTDNAGENVKEVIKLINSETFLENELSDIADIYISKEDCAELENCSKVYPVGV